MKFIDGAQIADARRAFLTARITDPKVALNFIFGPYGGGSTERPRIVIEWAKTLRGGSAGHAFWSVLQDVWPSFDLVPHFDFERQFGRLKPHWLPTDDIARLPAIDGNLRGQSKHAPPGLSWTLSRTVAEGFAVGHRGIRIREPVVLERVIDRLDVAMAFLDDRDEREVVLWTGTTAPPGRGARIVS